MKNVNEKIRKVILTYESIIDLGEADECFSLIADLTSLFYDLSNEEDE